MKIDGQDTPKNYHFIILGSFSPSKGRLRRTWIKELAQDGFSRSECDSRVTSKVRF